MPSLRLSAARIARAAARTGRRRRADRARRFAATACPAACPEASARTRSVGKRSPGSGSAGSTVTSPEAVVAVRAQTTYFSGTSPRRARYRVRPACRKCVGATSPSAAATNAGADMAASDSTAQSSKSRRTPYPRPVLNIRMTSRRSGSTDWAQSAACRLITSSGMTRASAAAPASPAALKVLSSRRSARITRTPRRLARSGTFDRNLCGSTTVTRIRCPELDSSSASVYASASPPQITKCGRPSVPFWVSRCCSRDISERLVRSRDCSTLMGGW